MGKVDKKSYQDHRAFMVYLSLRFPDDYFLFKFRMFKEFVKKVDFPYKPIAGRDANLTVYSELCEMLRNEIIEDNELLELHHGRLTDKHYIESSYNLLTQDIIYATVVHFERFENIETDESIFEKLIRVNKPLIPKTHEYNQNKKSSNAKVDYEKKQRSNKRLGNFGEQLVLKYELEKLKKLGSKKEPEYVAFTDDSQGFDILSFDENDKEIYIEVKTTTQSCEANFFITANELRKSIEAKEKYRLYRVYNYNEENDTGKFREFQGSLESLCTEPVVYITSLERN